ncbi:MAG: excinuclease ABC subunit UvrC [Eubacteriaceae bacterium]
MLNEKLKTLPENSGIYIMKDKDGSVIYVGKAINLKNRVKSYFNNLSGHDYKTKTLVSNICDLDYIITDNEVEALILENSLIKKYRPYYNIRLKDDKSYPYICITDEEYPRIIITREYKKNLGKYFGPYTNALNARKSVEILNFLYPVKMCSKNFNGKKQKRPCLNYDMNMCLAPCAYDIDKQLYNLYIKEIEHVLSGGYELLKDKIKEKMTSAAEREDYETAAILRDYLFSSQAISVKQKIVVSDDSRADIIALAHENDEAVIVVFERDEGSLADKKTISMEGVYQSSPESIMTEFVKQYYNTDAVVPKNIFLQYELIDDEAKSIEQMLTQRRGNKVNIAVPKIGDKKRLIDMLEQNAQNSLRVSRMRQEENAKKEEETLLELAKILNIEKPINKIEAFDISNIMGADNVGAMVVFNKTKKDKNFYRRFSIKSIDGADDYAAMGEVVFRRLKRAQEETEDVDETNKKFLPLPDIIFVDGGEAHVKIAKSIVDTFGYDIAIAGLKKDISHKLSALSFNNESIPLSKLKKCAKFLFNISEEVHRYAYEYHSVKRRQNMLSSVLEQIPQIGEKRRKSLMEYFKNIESIKNATIEDICKVEGINKQTAKIIYEYFKGDKNG